MKLKRWAALTVGLYVAILGLLAYPLLMAAWLKWSRQEHSFVFEISSSDALSMYREWGFYAWLAVLGSAQAVLLLVPLDLREKRLIPRVNIIIPILTASFLLGNLFLAGLLALGSAIVGDIAPNLLFVLGELILKNPLSDAAIKNTGLNVGSGMGDTLCFLTGFFQVMGVCWLVWGFIFYRFAKRDDHETVSARITRWLLRGSILELLVAVPSHVLVRARQTCCAPAGSFWGIVTGISVMLIAFGPGVFFLFADRISRLKPKQPIQR